MNQLQKQCIGKSQLLSSGHARASAQSAREYVVAAGMQMVCVSRFEKGPVVCEVKAGTG